MLKVSSHVVNKQQPVTALRYKQSAEAAWPFERQIEQLRSQPWVAVVQARQSSYDISNTDLSSTNQQTQHQRRHVALIQALSGQRLASNAAT
jgi:hypothetical protein